MRCIYAFIVRVYGKGEFLESTKMHDRHKIVYIAVDGEPEIACKLLKKLVGERGFEPPTPWSRTTCLSRC